MKKLIASFSIALVLVTIISVCRDVCEIERMTDKLIRLHVVADSDSEYSQTLKLRVRDDVLDYVSGLAEGCTSKSEAEDVILSHISDIERVSQNTLRENGCEDNVKVSYEKALVDRREYDGFTLPQGIYSALCIRIGRAQGKNWWCVLYPSLCTSCAVDIDELDGFSDEELTVIKTPEKVKYKLALFELFEKLRSKISGLNSLRQ